MWGEHGCVWVCPGVCRCVCGWVCTGVGRCSRVCMGVRGCAGGGCIGVHGCGREWAEGGCADVHGCMHVCGMNFQ